MSLLGLSMTRGVATALVLNFDAADGDNGDTWAGNSTTTAATSAGGSIVGTLETPDDVDWIAVELTAGQSYTISLSGTGASPVSDTYLRVWAPGSADTATGTLVGQNDDGGPGLNSELTFTAATTGTYYIDSRSYAGSYSGDYQVSVTDNGAPVPMPELTNAEIADYLVNGYWGDTGRSSRSFNVGADNAITVNITALSPQYQGFAIAALQTWTDITGVQFTQTAGSAEITFTQNGSGTAYNSSSTSGTRIISSSVNVSSDWVNITGPRYTLQTFIHEIGHAIGLGHAGNYNGSATYGVDNHYLNDSWQATVMSYFSQNENTYVNADFNYLLTPMLADVVAAQTLYGTSTTTRTGDTVYGYNSNAGTVFEFDNWQANYGNTVFALAIVDSGGEDTIDLSGSSADNLLYLETDRMSDVMGEAGNLGIGAGTVIENAIGGSGNDSIEGNAANNEIAGMGGNDSLLGNEGVDTLVGGAGNDTLNGGSFTDRLLGGADNDWLYGEGGNDILFGDAGIDRLEGGAGDDTLYGGGYTDVLLGGADDDRLFGENGNDILYGEAGVDRLEGGAGNDTLNGGGYTDVLLGGADDDRLFGNNGNDILFGDAGSDVLDGGAGNDTLHGNGQSDIFVFADGFGADTITDFDATDDLEDIDLSAVSAITDFNDLENNHLAQVGANAVITDGVNTITLLNVNVGDLDANDFTFVA